MTTSCPKCHGTGALRRVFYGSDPRCPDCNAHGEHDTAAQGHAASVHADWSEPAKQAQRAAARRARRAARDAS